MTHSIIPNCPQPETPIRDRAWTDEQIEATAAKYAERIARHLWRMHYADTAPQWEPLTGDLMGLLSQIDNMATGWTTPTLDAVVPEGWVLVPREPTPKMLAAVAGMEISVRVAEDDTAEYPVPEDDCAEIYRTMLAAAPSPGESA